jgi:hypothetical protein
MVSPPETTVAAAAPTVKGLQQSALLLVGRMCEIGRASPEVPA